MSFSTDMRAHMTEIISVVVGSTKFATAINTAKSAVLNTVASEYQPLDTVRLESMVWTKPAAASDTVMKTAQDISGGTVNITSFSAQPDYTRAIRLKFVGAGVTGTVTVTGTDMLGNTQHEDVEVDTTENLSYDTVKAFSSVTSVAGTLSGTGQNDTLSVGYTKALGLPKVSETDGVVRETYNGAVQSLGSLSDAFDTYTPTGTMDGAKAVEILYLTAE